MNNVTKFSGFSAAPGVLAIPAPWSTELRYTSPVLDPPLSPQDRWEPTGETYEAAVAWARLLEVDVITGSKEPSVLLLSKPDCTTAVVPRCPPAELIEKIKAYAEGTMDICAETQALGRILYRR